MERIERKEVYHMKKAQSEAIKIIPFDGAVRYCAKCRNAIGNTPFCPFCGKEQNPAPRRKKRGNGQGTVIKVGNKYKAQVTIGYYLGDDGKAHRKTRSRTFATKREAVAALGALHGEKDAPAPLTLLGLYRRWEPTHGAGESTMECYRAALKHLEPLWAVYTHDLTIDQLQAVLDDCPAGKRTRENMRALLGLLFKYAVPRGLAEMNLAQYLRINAEGGQHRSGFTLEEVEAIRARADGLPGAAVILCMIYTGFRPSEFLALTGDSFDPERMTLTGGAKTKAGKGRIVTISPKIARFIPNGAAGGPLWGEWASLKQFTEKLFYPTLTACGVENPIIDGRHKYTPHSCRHTFATLMKGVPGADKDKMQLIGHASGEMLRYYQDVGLEDLRAITDAI